MKNGASALSPKQSISPNGGSGGGNSGCVLSPDPFGGLSAYQDPRVPVIAPLPRKQGR